jgi:hypothetical protein
MLDNWSGIFRLVSPTGQMYKPDWVFVGFWCPTFDVGEGNMYWFRYSEVGA